MACGCQSREKVAQRRQQAEQTQKAIAQKRVESRERRRRQLQESGK